MSKDLASLVPPARGGADRSGVCVPPSWPPSIPSQVRFSFSSLMQVLIATMEKAVGEEWTVDMHNAWTELWFGTCEVLMEVSSHQVSSLWALDLLPDLNLYHWSPPLSTMFLERSALALSRMRMMIFCPMTCVAEKK